MGFTKLHKSPYGLVRFYRTVSPVQRFARCSLLSVALSIALPLLGITQHPALRSPDFPHPNIETRSSTQLKHLLRIPYFMASQQYQFLVYYVIWMGLGLTQTLCFS